MNLRPLLASFVRVLCGVRPLPATALPARGPCVFFANHSSHLDFAVLWAALPPAWRERTRPVAGRDYWEKTALHHAVACGLFRAVLIERKKPTVACNPLTAMSAALAAGDSLIVFPEGTRGDGLAVGEFKPGLHHLARAHPAVPLVPVFLANLNRIMPKGRALPVPLIAAVHPGAPLGAVADEGKEAFLARARAALIALHPS
ncbi:MAG: 1-acyl-sn-glycerol-3-phosphate acyltransferase [Opitutaceae bacterium]|nr:1-acyl-sn-glycerol-3-phosphate acyltransferase [Opitutaceae bacterium]